MSVTPHSRNAQLLERWRSTLNNGIIESPCTKVQISEETLIERILRSLKVHASKFPEKPAVIDAFNQKRWLTYQLIHDRALSFAAFLTSREFAVGDRVTAALPNLIEWPIMHLGTWAAGGTIVGSSAAFKLYETVYQLQDSASTVVVTTEQLLDTFIEAAKECPTVKLIICVRSSDKPLPEGVIDFEDTLNHKPLEKIAPVTLNTVSIIYYTSGTSGQPKGVIHTHRTYHYAVEMIRSHWELEVYPVLDDQKLNWYKEAQVLSSSCYHVLGFVLINCFLITGSPIILMRSFDGDVYLDVLEKFKPRTVVISPPVFQYLAKEVGENKSAMASVQMTICCAAPLSKELSDEFMSCHPGVKYILQGYGMTELGCFSHVPFPVEEGVNAAAGVVGSLFEQKLVDPETHQTCKQGQRGEVCLRGPPQTLGYLNKPAATKELIDNEGWVHTGDIGYVDERGFLFIVDRIKELIKVYHMNQSLHVPPAELEGILLSNSRIRDAAVIGIPDAARGELVRAFVVKADRLLTEREVEQLVADKLAEFKRITGGVVFIDAIPRSSAGKILRRVLREIHGA